MSGISNEIVDIPKGSFMSADGLVINVEGSNYYKSCDARVVSHVQKDTGVVYGSLCLKRAGHPGDIHEDYDGHTVGGPLTIRQKFRRFFWMVD